MRFVRFQEKFYKFVSEQIFVLLPKTEMKRNYFVPLLALLALSLVGCKRGGGGGDNEPPEVMFRLSVADNPSLGRNVTFHFDEERLLFEGATPLPMSSMLFVPQFEFGGKATVGGVVQESGVSPVDFSSDVTYEVTTATGVKRYTVRLSNFSGLPVVYINTGGAPIVNKEDWVAATMRIDGRGVASDLATAQIEIRGRGNSTWDYPKKTYAVKLGEKAEIFGMPKHKRWVLLAHWNDKVNIRTDLAFWLGREYADLDWQQGGQQVELFLNGDHMGGYYLCEHIKVDEGRIPDGYSIEVDSKADPADPVFRSNLTGLPFNVKDPEVEVGSAEFEYLRTFINDFEAILMGDDFLDPEIGYKSIADVESFVDWWLSNEFAKNADAHFNTSCYMNITAAGRLKMGPLWDYDVAWGNYVFDFDVTEYINSPEGFWIKGRTAWIDRMMEDPEFVALAQEKWAQIYADRQRIMEQIDLMVANQINSACLNDLVWGRLTGTYDPTIARSAYLAEVSRFRTWVEKRFRWLNSAIEAL